MASPPAVACIILAAGRSTRMGANKLLADVGGRPMLRIAAETALASGARPVLVVTGHQSDAARAALAGLDIGFVDSPDYAAGLSASLKAGLRAVPPDCRGALVMLGDMPRITAAHLDALVAAFADDECRIIVPVHEGRIGNPLLWPADLFAEMLQLQGDAGARSLLSGHADRVREVAVATDAIFADVDTPEALAAVRSGTRPPGPS